VSDIFGVHNGITYVHDGLSLTVPLVANPNTVVSSELEILFSATATSIGPWSFQHSTSQVDYWVSEADDTYMEGGGRGKHTAG
jgi:hypothetical protein